MKENGGLHVRFAIPQSRESSQQQSPGTLGRPGEHPPPFRDDSIKAKVDWKYPHDLVFEKPVRLKFYLHQARLYSFWLE